jgi:hypothetical protein
MTNPMFLDNYTIYSITSIYSNSKTMNNINGYHFYWFFHQPDFSKPSNSLSTILFKARGGH